MSNPLSYEKTESSQMLSVFWEQLSQTQRGVLFLDYDGTLAPFQVERDKAVPYPGVREILNKIIEIGNSRVIVVTGRYTNDLIPLIGLEKLPEIWGSHGLERLFPDGRYEIKPLSKKVLEGLSKAANWAEKEGLKDRCEEKPGCLALHLRGLEPLISQDIRSKALTAWSYLTQKKDLELHEFDGGIELRVKGHHKGIAVNTVLAELTESAGVAYLGDDLTDEDAFKALKGKGLSILVRNEWRSTEADIWLKPPHELLDFLKTWHLICSGRK